MAKETGIIQEQGFIIEGYGFDKISKDKEKEESKKEKDDK